jgi:hypothetical protein
MSDNNIYDSDINGQDTSGDRYERAAKFVRKFVEKSSDYREPHIELAIESRELYESWSAQAKTRIQRANLKLPYGFAIIETELAQLSDLFLKEKPLFKFVGREPTDVMWENRLTDFHDMQVENMRFREKCLPLQKALLLDGTVVAKVPYRYDERIVDQRMPQQDPFTGEVFTAKQKVLKVLFDGPDLEQIPLIDFFPDWRTTAPGDIRGMRGCVHRTYKSYNELKRNKKYKNLEEVETSIRGRGCDAWKAPRWSENFQDSFDTLNDNELNKKKEDLLEVWEYWGEYDLEKDGEFVECVITVVNGEVAIRVDDNFYDDKIKPFVASVNIPRDGEFYGIPELLAVKGLIREATVLRNARLDQTNLSVNRMFVVDRAAGIKQNSLYVRPNGVIYTNDMNGIRALEMPDSSPTSQQEIQGLQMEIQSATGGVGTAGGMSQMARTFGRSATGAQMVSNMTSARIGMKARLFAYLFIRPMQEIMFATNHQFVTDEQWVRVTDPNEAAENPFTVLDPSAFNGNYDFEFVTTFEESADTELAKMQQFAQLAQAAEQTQPGTIKWGPVFEATGRALLGRQVKNFVRSEQERMEMQMQMMAAEQAANAAAGANAMQPNALPGATRN